MKCITKHITILLMVIFSTSCFSACFDVLEEDNLALDDYYETYYFVYDYESNKNRVETIDLIDYTPQVMGWWDRWGEGKIPYYEYKPFDESKVVVKEVLPQEEVDGFLRELSAISVYKFDQKESDLQCNTPFGRGIRISYDDGSFDLISYGIFYVQRESYEEKMYSSYYTKFLANGEISQMAYIGMYDWYMLVAANYFDIKIEPIDCEVVYVQIGDDR